MDTEQSGEVVEGSGEPHQELKTEKEVASTVETPAESEEPESDQVNGHVEVETTHGTEQAEANKENLPKEDPKKESAPGEDADKAGLDAGAGKEAKTNQSEQDKPAAEPENETVPEPATAQEPVEVQPPKEEKVVAKDEKKGAGKAGEPDKGEEKLAEVALATGDKEKKEDQSGKPTEEVQEAEKSDTAGAEAAITATAAAQLEEKEAEEDPTPAAGTLAFAILEQVKTKDALMSARTLVILRGLPGSGKSFLARAIAEAYSDHCTVVSGDDHGVKPESSSSSGDAYKAFDEAIVGRCSTDGSPGLIVVDDTNHTLDRLAQLGGIAKRHKLVAMFLEPRTEWSRDPAVLTKKTKRGLEQAKVEAMKAPLLETSIPLYFGWFPFFTVQDTIKETSLNFIKTLMTLESFKKHLEDFCGKEEAVVDFEQYFKAKGTLHCTAKFTNYGKAEGAKEYAEKQAVGDMYGFVSDLSLSALFVTPRTIGARVSLTEDQLQLWPDDGEKEAESVVPNAGSLPRGSRAHITLGCVDGVQPVQTGYDLLQILLLQKEEAVKEEIDSGTLTYYGEGRWYLALKEQISATACFSSVYKAKAPGQPKKEKKKPKCAIL